MPDGLGEPGVPPVEEDAADDATTCRMYFFSGLSKLGSWRICFILGRLDGVTPSMLLMRSRRSFEYDVAIGG